jgi:hypothetical protein
VRVAAVVSAIAAQLINVACGSRTSLIDDVDVTNADGGAFIDAASDAFTNDAFMLPIGAVRSILARLNRELGHGSCTMPMKDAIVCEIGDPIDVSEPSATFIENDVIVPEP